MSTRPQIILVGLMAVAAAALIIAGSRDTNSELGRLLLLAGIIGSFLTGLSWMIVARRAESVERRIAPPAPVAHPMIAESSRVAELLEHVLDNLTLSEPARRVLFADHERQILQRAVDDLLQSGDDDAADRLCDRIEEAGLSEDATALRQRIEHFSRQQHEAEVAKSITHVDSLLAAYRWPAAHEEAARLRQLYPDVAIVQAIEHRINESRAKRKDELEREFLEAADHEEIERATSVLRELDRYLTPDEAGRFSEVAESVLVRHRENLGAQFKLAVNDRRWGEAARAGELIITEFPNSKMAEEVRSMIDVLRTRATQAALSATEAGA